MTSHDYQVTSHSETRTRINCPCGPFKHTVVEHCVKKSPQKLQFDGESGSVVNKDLSFKDKAKDLTSEHVQGSV